MSAGAIFGAYLVGLVIAAVLHWISAPEKPKPTPPIDPFPRSTFKTIDEKRICK